MGNRLLQVSAKFDRPVVRLRLSNMLKCYFGGLIGVSQIGVMYLIGERGGGDEYGKRSNESFFHGFHLRLQLYDMGKRTQ